MFHWSPSPPHSTPWRPSSASGWPDRYPQIKGRNRKELNVWNQLRSANAQGSSTHIMMHCANHSDCEGNYRLHFRSARSVNVLRLMWTKITIEMQSAAAKQVQWQEGERATSGVLTALLSQSGSWGPLVILIQHLVHSEDIFPETTAIEIYGSLNGSRCCPGCLCPWGDSPGSAMCGAD